MKIYDYFKTAEDMKNGKIYATFTEEHDAERLHFESLSICTCCRVSDWPDGAPVAPAAERIENEAAAAAAGSLAGRVVAAARVFLLACCLSAADGLTAAPAGSTAADDLTPCELLTPDPLAEVIRLQAAGLTVSHVTIKSTTPAAC